MTARRGRSLRAAVLVAVAAASLVAAPAPARAQPGRPDVDRQVLVFLVDAVSFEELLAVPEIRALARAGGAALMSPTTVPGDRGPGAYLTLGAGVRGGAPTERVIAYDRREPIGGRPAGDVFRERYPDRPLPPGPFLMDPGAYVRANGGHAVPGLLGSVVVGSGREVQVLGNSDTDSGLDRPGMLVGMNRQGAGVRGAVGLAFVSRPGSGPPIPVPMDGEEANVLGGHRTDYGLLGLVATGGDLHSPEPSRTPSLMVVDLGDTRRIDASSEGAPPGLAARQRRAVLGQAGQTIEFLVRAAARRDVLVLVVTPSTSRDMDAAKDQLTPIVMARGDPGELFPQREPIGIETLTSDTTRRAGVVSNEDVAPTILSFFQLPVPEEMRGSPIRTVSEPAPFELHRRHLANRRMSVPVQAAAGIYVTLGGLFGVLLVAARRREPWPPARAARWAGLSVLPLGAALLAAGHLSTLSYGTVVPFVVGLAVVVVLSLVPLGRFGLWAPPAVLGIAVMLFLVVESAMGWTAALTPFLGGSELDGARFYGLPNVFIGLLMGAAVYIAVGLHPVAGSAVIAAVALFAGLPWTGANIGGSIALFAAAGLWLGVRSRHRLGWREAGVAAAVTVAGVGFVLLVHGLLADSPTHATRFVRDTGLGPFAVVTTAVERLGVGLRLIARNPFALLPVIGLPVLLVALLYPFPQVREAFEGRPEWRDAVLVLTVGGIVAYLTNDSGPAACGLCFGAALGALLYVALAPRPGGPAEVDRARAEPTRVVEAA